tara:strand:+ start:3018 stop:3698 length:681 start_codon:yes stop_codon:yes gene_type:complete
MSSSNQIGYQWKPTTNKIIQQKKKDVSKLNAFDETGISLCIPFAFKNITPNKVFAVMKNPTILYKNGDKVRGSFGFIERIDYILRRDGNKTYFVHFRANSWNFNNATGLQALNNMKEGKDIEIINDKWGHFWKVSISKAERPEEEQDEQDEQDEPDDTDSDKEEFQIYPKFELSYNDEFPNITNEVALAVELASAEADAANEVALAVALAVSSSEEIPEEEKTKGA